MKTKGIIKTKIKLFLELIGKILMSLLIGVIVYSIANFFFEDYIGSFLEEHSYDLYYWAVRNRDTIMYIGLYVILLVTIYRFISKYVNSTKEVYNSLENILKEDDNTIKITNDVYKFGEKLNEIKYNYIISKTNQRDAEQKKNDLIMYMAHDLKTPLTSIIGYLTLLSDEKDISKSLEDKYINIALNKSLRVEELINQFFDITRYNLHSMPINKSKINLCMLLNQLIEECYPMLEQNKLKCHLEADSEVIYNGDGDKLARTFDNLLKNAINYSYENTTIDILMKENDKEINILFKNQGDKIPDYKINKIFDKFYRADDSRTTKTGGAGLGLAITKEIIDLHGGTIKVENIDSYIVFNITLYK